MIEKKAKNTFLSFPIPVSVNIRKFSNHYISIKIEAMKAFLNRPKYYRNWGPLFHGYSIISSNY